MPAARDMTNDQLEELKVWFDLNATPSRNQVDVISSKVGLPSAMVWIWFHRHRIRVSNRQELLHLKQKKQRVEAAKKQLAVADRKLSHVTQTIKQGSRVLQKIASDNERLTTQDTSKERVKSHQRPTGKSNPAQRTEKAATYKQHKESLLLASNDSSQRKKRFRDVGRHRHGHELCREEQNVEKFDRSIKEMKRNPQHPLKSCLRKVQMVEKTKTGVQQSTMSHHCEVKNTAIMNTGVKLQTHLNLNQKLHTVESDTCHNRVASANACEAGELHIQTRKATVSKTQDSSRVEQGNCDAQIETKPKKVKMELYLQHRAAEKNLRNLDHRRVQRNIAMPSVRTPKKNQTSRLDGMKPRRQGEADVKDNYTCEGAESTVVPVTSERAKRRGKPPLTSLACDTSAASNTSQNIASRGVPSNPSLSNESVEKKSLRIRAPVGKTSLSSEIEKGKEEPSMTPADCDTSTATKISQINGSRGLCPSSAKDQLSSSKKSPEKQKGFFLKKAEPEKRKEKSLPNPAFQEVRKTPKDQLSPSKKRCLKNPASTETADRKKKPSVTPAACDTSTAPVIPPKDQHSLTKTLIDKQSSRVGVFSAFSLSEVGAESVKSSNVKQKVTKRRVEGAELAGDKKKKASSCLPGTPVPVDAQENKLCKNKEQVKALMGQRIPVIVRQRQKEVFVNRLKKRITDGPLRKIRHIREAEKGKGQPALSPDALDTSNSSSQSSVISSTVAEENCMSDADDTHDEVSDRKSDVDWAGPELDSNMNHCDDGKGKEFVTLSDKIDAVKRTLPLTSDNDYWSSHHTSFLFKKELCISLVKINISPEMHTRRVTVSSKTSPRKKARKMDVEDITHLKDIDSGKLEKPSDAGRSLWDVLSSPHHGRDADMPEQGIPFLSSPEVASSPGKEQLSNSLQVQDIMEDETCEVSSSVSMEGVKQDTGDMDHVASSGGKADEDCDGGLDAGDDACHVEDVILPVDLKTDHDPSLCERDVNGIDGGVEADEDTSSLGGNENESEDICGPCCDSFHQEIIALPDMHDQSNAFVVLDEVMCSDGELSFDSTSRTSTPIIPRSIETSEVSAKHDNCMNGEESSALPSPQKEQPETVEEVISGVCVHSKVMDHLATNLDSKPAEKHKFFQSSVKKSCETVAMSHPASSAEDAASSNLTKECNSPTSVQNSASTEQDVAANSSPEELPDPVQVVENLPESDVQVAHSPAANQTRCTTSGMGKNVESDAVPARTGTFDKNQLSSSDVLTPIKETLAEKEVDESSEKLLDLKANQTAVETSAGDLKTTENCSSDDIFPLVAQPPSESSCLCSPKTEDITSECQKSISHAKSHRLFSDTCDNLDTDSLSCNRSSSPIQLSFCEGPSDTGEDDLLKVQDVLDNAACSDELKHDRKSDAVSFDASSKSLDSDMPPMSAGKDATCDDEEFELEQDHPDTEELFCSESTLPYPGTSCSSGPVSPHQDGPNDTTIGTSPLDKSNSSIAETRDTPSPFRNFPECNQSLPLDESLTDVIAHTDTTKDESCKPPISGVEFAPLDSSEATPVKVPGQTVRRPSIQEDIVISSSISPSKSSVVKDHTLCETATSELEQAAGEGTDIATEEKDTEAADAQHPNDYSSAKILIKQTTSSASICSPVQSVASSIDTEADTCQPGGPVVHIKQEPEGNALVDQSTSDVTPKQSSGKAVKAKAFKSLLQLVSELRQRLQQEKAEKAEALSPEKAKDRSPEKHLPYSLVSINRSAKYTTKQPSISPSQPSNETPVRSKRRIIFNKNTKRPPLPLAVRRRLSELNPFPFDKHWQEVAAIEERVLREEGGCHHKESLEEIRDPDVSACHTPEPRCSSEATQLNSGIPTNDAQDPLHQNSSNASSLPHQLPPSAARLVDDIPVASPILEDMLNAPPMVAPTRTARKRSNSAVGAFDTGKGKGETPRARKRKQAYVAGEISAMKHWVSQGGHNTSYSQEWLDYMRDVQSSAQDGQQDEAHTVTRFSPPRYGHPLASRRDSATDSASEGDPSQEEFTMPSIVRVYSLCDEAAEQEKDKDPALSTETSPTSGGPSMDVISEGMDLSLASSVEASASSRKRHASGPPRTAACAPSPAKVVAASTHASLSPPAYSPRSKQPPAYSPRSEQPVINNSFTTSQAAAGIQLYSPTGSNLVTPPAVAAPVNQQVMSGLHFIQLPPVANAFAPPPNQTQLVNSVNIPTWNTLSSLSGMQPVGPAQDVALRFLKQSGSAAPSIQPIAMNGSIAGYQVMPQGEVVTSPNSSSQRSPVRDVSSPTLCTPYPTTSPNKIVVGNVRTLNQPVSVPITVSLNNNISPTQQQQSLSNVSLAGLTLGPTQVQPPVYYIQGCNGTTLQSSMMYSTTK